jgi:hypothetical protein
MVSSFHDNGLSIDLYSIASYYEEYLTNIEEMVYKTLEYSDANAFIKDRDALNSLVKNIKQTASESKNPNQNKKSESLI